MICNWILLCVRAARSASPTRPPKQGANASALRGGRAVSVESLEDRRMMANLATEPFYDVALDFNQDDVIDAADQDYITSRLGSGAPDDLHLDLNEDGAINIFDVQVLLPHLGAVRLPESTPEPSLPTAPPPPPTPEPPPLPEPPQTPQTPANPPPVEPLSVPDPPVFTPEPPAVPEPPAPPEPVAPPAPSPVLPVYEAIYDIDRDWDIDEDDLHLASPQLGPVTPQNAHFDFDGNGRVDAFDIASIAHRTDAKPVDLNGDGLFDAFDFGALVGALVSTEPDLRLDLDGNGGVDLEDLRILEAAYASRLSAALPAVMPPGEETPSDGPVHAPNQTIRINPGLRIGAYYDMGGGVGNIRNLSFNVEETGWDAMIRQYVQPVVDAGVPFAEFHNIWGLDNGGLNGMRFPIYSQLADDPELPLLISSFVPAFRAFHDANPDFETIAYVGSPYTSPAPKEVEGDPDAWWSLVYETVIPLIDAGFTSVGFDASGSDRIWQRPLDLELYHVLMNPDARLRDRERHAPLIEALGGDPDDPDDPGRAITVYFEALPVNNRRHGMPDRAGELGHDHVIITDEHLRQQDPERTDENGKPTAKHPSFIANAERLGEMEEINIIVPNASCTARAGIGYAQTREACFAEMRNILTEANRNATVNGNIRLLINPRFLVSVSGNQVNWAAPEANTPLNSAPQAHAQNKTMNDFVQELNLAALPTRIDLDPNGLNPDGVQYTITRAPRNGGLAQSAHDAAVFVYTPNNRFKGTDYFEYAATDGEHEATGRITLQVD